jgi:hypothetical protein
MLTVVVSPEREQVSRSVLIQDEDRQIVAVMNTRLGGTERAVKLALDFAEAAANKTRLDEALATIRALRLGACELSDAALHSAGASGA